MPIRLHTVLPGIVALLCAPGLAAMELRQNLDEGDRHEITSANDEMPTILVQSSGRVSTSGAYDEDSIQPGLHIRTGAEITLPTDIRLNNLNTSHVIGAHGEDTVVRYTGRWEADGGNAFPRLSITEGARFIFTEESSMNLVMDGAFFTRQLWVYGDGSGTLELEEGFVADHTVNEPLANAMGTIRLGGVTLITHHTRNMPQNTRPDGRGGHYKNGHIVFERVPGNRWIIDSSNHYYSAQLDFDTDATLDIRSSLTHVGHRRVAMQVGPGGYFISTGAFRTTSPDVTITKTGPGMLALDGEQSYHRGAALVLQEGLTRMSGDPGLGRDNTTREDTGAFLHITAQGEAGLQLAAPVSHLRRIDLTEQSRLWLDQDCRLVISEGLHVGPNAQADLRGEIFGKLQVEGRIDLLSSHSVHAEALELAGTWTVNLGRWTPEHALMQVTATAEVSQAPEISFRDRRGRVPEGDVVLLRSGNLKAADAVSGDFTTSDGRFSYTLRVNDGELILGNIAAVEE
ncbi:MAG: hypothetical protein EA401_08335 [Planctomycetota bacterium]|nr:MAG: hypothetical protein EA401_08335 [Planctomycetota bacterium]